MILLVGLMLAATPAQVTCAPDGARATRPWLKGEYAATPVQQAKQTAAMKRLGHRSLIPISVTLARAVTGKGALKTTRHYYLAKIAYVGSGVDPRNVPDGIALSLDVDSKGVAYVTSFRLTSESGMSNLAAVLTSQTRLKS